MQSTEEITTYEMKIIVPSQGDFTNFSVNSIDINSMNKVAPLAEWCNAVDVSGRYLFNLTSRETKDIQYIAQ